MGARVDYTGVGLLGSFLRSRPAELRQLIVRVLAEESFRQHARQLQRAMLAAGGAARAAEIVEQAVLTRRPVLRL
jgi:UDP:flavonoid glycosyltransferase YjiC (YdhE family)